MEAIAASPIVTSTPAAAAAPKQPTAPENAGSGVQGFIADAIRSSAAGYKQATKMAGVQADKAAIVPFETVATGTALLKEKTANIKGVNKATSVLHTIGGFALLILTANASSTLRSPGETAQDIGNRVADLIDGRKTAEGWSLGWGIRAEEEPDAATLASSELGAAGML